MKGFDELAKIFYCIHLFLHFFIVWLGQEVDAPKCIGNNLILHLFQPNKKKEVDKISERNCVFLVSIFQWYWKQYHPTKTLHRKTCCFALNTMSCPISCRAGMWCSGGLHNLLSQILHIWQTSQWIVSYMFVIPDFFQILRQAGRKPNLIPSSNRAIQFIS